MMGMFIGNDIMDAVRKMVDDSKLKITIERFDGGLKMETETNIPDGMKDLRCSMTQALLTEALVNFTADILREHVPEEEYAKEAEQYTDLITGMFGICLLKALGVDPEKEAEDKFNEHG